MRKRSKVKRLVSRVLVLLTALGLVTMGTYVANASPVPDDRYFPFGMNTTEFSVQPFSSDAHPDWNAALANAVEEWNDSNPAINISIDSRSLNTVGFDAELPRRALYSKICVPFICKFNISIRDNGAEQEDGWILDEGQFLLVHELGHALGLNDVIETVDGNLSVMSAKKNYGITRPSIYDMQLLMARVSVEKNQKSMLAGIELSSFLTPIWRAFNGYN
jgi:hypothetical protein